MFSGRLFNALDMTSNYIRNKNCILVSVLSANPNPNPNRYSAPPAKTTVNHNPSGNPIVIGQRDQIISVTKSVSLIAHSEVLETLCTWCWMFLLSKLVPFTSITTSPFRICEGSRYGNDQTILFCFLYFYGKGIGASMYIKLMPISST